MIGVLVIPCWNRPEFLWHTLDNLTKAEGLERVHIVFKPDTAFHTDILKVIDDFAPRLPSYEIRTATPARYRLTKQSQNVLEGYAYAATLTDGLIFMVEEDIMVGRDFFRFHETLHAERPEIFASLSVKNPNRSAPTESDSSAYYLSHGDYCSLGVCMKAQTFRNYVQPHMNEAYYRDPIRYCSKFWPASSIDGSQAEQDGLIRRIQESGDMPTAYPHVPRAFHAGFYGYNRRQFVTGSLEQKIQRVKDTIYSPETMLAASLTPAYYQDSQPIPLQITPWKILQWKQPASVDYPIGSDTPSPAA